jgi:ribosomal protein S18 acetylase RimI-like enzyme
LIYSIMIRAARADEADELVDIVRRSFEKVSIDKSIEDTFGPVTGLKWHERKAMDIRRDIAVNFSGVFVAETGGKIAGFVTVILDKAANTGRVSHLAVSPEHQGKGFGKSLLYHALKYIKGSGMKLMRIEVLAHNANAREMYLKAGFKEVAKQLHLAMPSDNFKG